MDELLQQTIDGAAASAAAEAGLGPPSTANAMVFLLITALGVVMAVVYVPIRLVLTITARKRRYLLLQRIRRLREDLAPAAPPPATAASGPIPPEPADLNSPA